MDIYNINISSRDKSLNINVTEVEKPQPMNLGNLATRVLPVHLIVGISECTRISTVEPTEMFKEAAFQLRKWHSNEPH